MSNSTSEWAPYIVCQGDTLTSLAARCGVTRDAIWNNPKNKDLSDLRSNGDILAPGDVIYLPPPSTREWLSVKLGETNKFVATVPTMTVRVKLSDYPSASYVAEAGTLRLKGTTDGSGGLELVIPVHTQEVHVKFDSPSGDVVLLVGHLDPIDTTSGLRQRLTALGYPTPQDEGHGVRRMLAVFQHDQGLPPTGELDADTRGALERQHGM